MASRAIKSRANIKKKHPSTAVIAVAAVVFAFIVSLCWGIWSVGSSWLSDLPDYKSADAYNTAQPTVVYASDGQTVLAEFQLENRDPVEINEISDYALKGTVATEDERFYSHGAIDPWGIGRALVNNLMGGDLEGASTITQQFVRNTILSSEMDDISIKRKVREAYISIKLEEQYSKDNILLMYLNTINYGSGAYRGRIGALLLEARKRAHHCRSGDACGHSPVTDVQQPDQLPRELHEAPQRGARPHALERRHHPGRARRRSGRAPRA